MNEQAQIQIETFPQAIQALIEAINALTCQTAKLNQTLEKTLLTALQALDQRLKRAEEKLETLTAKPVIY